LAVQVHPARQQQPALALRYTLHAPAFAEEFPSTHFFDGFIGVLQDVELAAHHAAVGRPFQFTPAIGNHKSRLPNKRRCSSSSVFRQPAATNRGRRLGGVTALLGKIQGVVLFGILSLVAQFLYCPRLVSGFNEERA
jgi:hypothetical protein